MEVNKTFYQVVTQNNPKKYESCPLISHCFLCIWKQVSRFRTCFLKRFQVDNRIWTRLLFDKILSMSLFQDCCCFPLTSLLVYWLVLSKQTTVLTRNGKKIFFYFSPFILITKPEIYVLILYYLRNILKRWWLKRNNAGEQQKDGWILNGIEINELVVNDSRYDPCHTLVHTVAC